METKKLNNKQVKEALLDTLVYFDKICKKYDLKYTLDAGTLLGAVRHHGFIPWDDDIDVAMPYKDYKKLISLSSEINKNNRFIIHGYSKEINDKENYIYPYLKLEDNHTIADFKMNKDQGGAWVDIFPLNNVPANSKLYLKYIRKLRIYYRLLFIGNRRFKENKIKSGIRSLIYLDRNRMRDKMIKSIDKLDELPATNYLSETIGNCMCDTSTEVFRKKIPVEWFDNLAELEFEGYKFCAISEYEKYLTMQYGDWRKLPPLEDRVNGHSFDLFRK
ncbi:LicD family protein [Lactobacillus johnsonii]|uniref:LicD family protein n=1 Tax=Lactobacillus johnsonii TaxID=33959 RepID=UPI003D04A07C